jgi:porin
MGHAMKTPLAKALVVGLYLAALAWTASARAETGAPDVTTALDLAAAYKLDLLRVRGGAHPGAGALGNLDVKLRADLDALWGWRDDVAYLHVIHDHGARLNAERTGSLMGISNIEVPATSGKVLHAWLQHGFLDNRLSLLAGLYPIDSEFSTMDSAGVFLHPSFGASADLALTRGPSIFNTAAVGLRLRWDGAERDRYAMFALLDGLPGHPGKARGTHIRLDDGDGAFAIAEFGLMPQERGHVFEPTDPSSPQTQAPDIRQHEKYENFGKYALGAWGYSAKVDDLVDVDGLGRPLKRHSRGAYVLAEKTLLRETGSPTHHLAGFARLSFTDGDSTAIERALNLGLRLRAPFAAREDDMLGIAYSHAWIGDKQRAAWAAAGRAAADAERALEITYRYQMTDRLALQPVYQRIQHPGGDAAARAATVLGARLEVTTP